MKYLPGEQEAIEIVCSLGEKYGYGNLIARLKSAWSHKLLSKGSGLSKLSKVGADIWLWHVSGQDLVVHFKDFTGTDEHMERWRNSLADIAKILEGV